PEPDALDGGVAPETRQAPRQDPGDPKSDDPPSRRHHTPSSTPLRACCPTPLARRCRVPDVERSYPSHLAARVRGSWPADALPLPARLEVLLDTAYHASFLRDEERPVAC